MRNENDINVSMNIGYESSAGSAGVLNKIPMCWIFDNPKEFTKFIRKSMIDILGWSVSNHVPKSSLMLYVNIDRFYMEDGREWMWSNEFCIPCKNIREYKPFLEMTQDEVIALTEARKREIAINDVLDGKESD